jgi:hypothetical protein
MSEFKRYRDANGSEFSLAVSPELAEKKGWKDVTSDTNPAVSTDGKPLPAKPADATATKAKAATTSKES